MFAAGAVLGGLLAGLVFAKPKATHLSERVIQALHGLGITLLQGCCQQSCSACTVRPSG